jgi:3-hydroxyisobutyrate dehydrogenase and related beta-hydroxyacid dehydrogenases
VGDGRPAPRVGTRLGPNPESGRFVMTELGFIGLGTMGSAIARRLMDAGHTVRVWNRSPAAMEPLVAAGAVAAESPIDALSTDVTFSMLADDAAVDAVFNAATLGAATGGLHVNMASVSPAMARRLSARHAAEGIGYVAAPVLGRKDLAAVGKLNILVGGITTEIDQVAPYLDAIGVRTWRMGNEPAQANLVKIAVNFNLIHAIEALGESIAIVENHGIDPHNFVDLLTQTLFAGVAYTGYGGIIANRRYQPPGFTLQLGLKDLGLAESAALEAGVTLPSAETLRSVFEQAISNQGADELDWAAIAEISRTRDHTM